MKKGFHVNRTCDKISECGRVLCVASIWASEASPTLGCSIEISRDILYVCVYVYDCLWETHTKNSYAKMCGQNYVVKHAHAQSQFWEFETTFIRPVKTDL